MTSTIRNCFVRGLMLLSVATAIAVFAHAVNAADPPPQPVEIAAQPLAEALVEVGRQFGVVVVAPEALTAGKTAPAIAGVMTAHQAIERLLSGSNLIVNRTHSGGFVVAQQSQQPSRASSDAPLELRTITVTGQKVRRTLDEVPASVVVLDGAEAEGGRSRDARLAIQGIPNVISENGSNTPSIRGLDGSARATGGAAVVSGTISRIPTLVDGVPLPTTISTASSLTTLWDVDTIEVARGPQSTSGGRNSIGGAVRIETNDPEFEYEGALRASYFNQDGTQQGALMFNVPLVEDQVAARLAAEFSDGESFIDFVDPIAASVRDELEDEDLNRVRAKLAIEPRAVDGLRVQLGIDHTESKAQFMEGVEDSDWRDLRITDLTSSSSALEDNERNIYQAEVAYRFNDHFDFEARFSHLDNDVLFTTPPLGALDLTADTESQTLEALLRFSDIGFVTDGVIGIAHETREDKGLNTTAFFPAEWLADNENTGVFAEADFDLGRLGLPKGWVLTAGARIERDERDRAVTLFGIPLEDSVKETEFIPKLGMRYQPNDDITVGYLYSRGYKPGGIDFNFFVPPTGASIFGSETLDNHELFMRGQFLDGRLDVNSTLFYYVFHDAQIRGFDTTGILMGNADQAEGYGLELEIAYRFADGFELTSGLGLLDTEITDPGPNNPEQKGAELERAPNVTGNLGLAYFSPSGFDASIAARYVGSSKPAFFEETLPAYTVVNLTAGYTTETYRDTELRISGFVENLFDKVYRTEDFPLTGTRRAVGRPRTIGLTAELRF